MSNPLISVITWDASFREAFHLFYWINQQSDISSDEFEFLWVNYHEKLSDPVRNLIDKSNNNIKGLTFNGSGLWWHTH